jgi:predicted trehalose synthase
MAASDNLVLEHLGAIRSDLASQRSLLGEHGVRLTEIAASVAGPRRDQAMDAETGAHLAARLDRLRDEIDMIKRRLDLREE